jgi:hypothetical protein
LSGRPRRRAHDRRVQGGRRAARDHPHSFPRSVVAIIETQAREARCGRAHEAGGPDLVGRDAQGATSGASSSTDGAGGACRVCSSPFERAHRRQGNFVAGKHEGALHHELWRLNFHRLEQVGSGAPEWPIKGTGSQAGAAIIVAAPERIRVSPRGKSMARSSSKHPRGGAARFIVRPLFAALVASGVIASGGLHAATIVVTTGGDAGNAGTCTLRQAVGAMNAASVAGTSCVNSGGVFGTVDLVDLTGQAGTITLAGASEIVINASLAIQGPGSTVLAVSGANASRVFHSTNPFSILRIDDLTIANGRAGGLAAASLSRMNCGSRTRSSPAAQQCTTRSNTLRISAASAAASPPPCC